MARISLSNGKEVDLYSSRFIHILLTIHKTSQTKELGGFQNGEAMTAQRTTAANTEQADFHGNANFFDTEDESGQMTFNTLPASSTTEDLDAVFNWQANSAPGVDDFINITVKNDDTGQIMFGEGGRVNLTNDQVNETAFSLAWTILFGRFVDNWKTPTDPVFAALTNNQ